MLLLFFLIQHIKINQFMSFTHQSCYGTPGQKLNTNGQDIIFYILCC